MLSIWAERSEAVYPLLYALNEARIREQQRPKCREQKFFFSFCSFFVGIRTPFLFTSHTASVHQSRLLSVRLCIAPHLILSLISNLYFSNGVKYTSLRLFFHEVQIQFASSQALKDHILLYPK